jgi:hypothetical protein
MNNRWLLLALRCRTVWCQVVMLLGALDISGASLEPDLLRDARGTADFVPLKSQRPPETKEVP